MSSLVPVLFSAGFTTIESSRRLYTFSSNSQGQGEKKEGQQVQLLMASHWPEALSGKRAAPCIWEVRWPLGVPPLARSPTYLL